MVRLCSIPNCERKHYAHGFCSKHFQQRRLGEEGRGQRDPNKYIIEGDTCIISLYNRISIKIAETIIDAEDYDKCKSHKWCAILDSRGDTRVSNHKMGFLSDYLMGIRPTKSLCVDHKDGNTLNNRRKTNLQICTIQQNNMKKKKQKNNTSGYRGVVWSRNKWMAQIQYNRKNYNLGYFTTKEEAALAYNKKAIEVHGSFASLNIIEGAS